jgi:hypothetical protein
MAKRKAPRSAARAGMRAAGSGSKRRGANGRSTTRSTRGATSATGSGRRSRKSKGSGKKAAARKGKQQKPPAPQAKRSAGRKTAPARKTGTARAPSRKMARKAAPKATRKTAGKRSSKAAPRRGPGLPAGASSNRRARPREDEMVPSPPSSLNFDRHPSAARSGRAEFKEALAEHTETSPALTGGDVDADWESAYSSGDEAPGGHMPTPDQAVVEEIGTALGVEYQDDEELKGAVKIEQRDRHRWELDPASSEDYQERAKPERRKR